MRNLSYLQRWPVKAACDWEELRSGHYPLHALNSGPSTSKAQGCLHLHPASALIFLFHFCPTLEGLVGGGGGDRLPDPCCLAVPQLRLLNVHLYSSRGQHLAFICMYSKPFLNVMERWPSTLTIVTKNKIPTISLLNNLFLPQPNTSLTLLSM